MWSLGVILYMLVCGQPPFQEANDSETLTMIMDCKYTMPPHISSECRRLIASMLVREPEKRATIEVSCFFPFFLCQLLELRHYYFFFVLEVSMEFHVIKVGH